MILWNNYNVGIFTPVLQMRKHQEGTNKYNNLLRIRKQVLEGSWQPTPVFLPGESPWTEEPGELQSMGLRSIGHD